MPSEAGLKEGVLSAAFGSLGFAALSAVTGQSILVSVLVLWTAFWTLLAVVNTQ